MKNIFLFSILFVLFFFNPGMAQTIDTDCTNVTVTGGIPNYQSNLYDENVQWTWTGKCAGIVANPTITMKHKMFLQKLNHQTGLFETVSGPQFPPNNTFSNPGHGTYRVKVVIPVPITSNSCVSGLVQVFSNNSQLIGYLGIHGGESFTNELIAGETTPADISYIFIDGDGNDLLNVGFDFGETVKIDASASKNYDLWWLSIAELGGQQRYHYKGWTNGTVGIINLTNFWNERNWNFEETNAYKVQFAVENNKCINSNWNNLPQTFFICLAGTGCRPGSDFDKKIAISPNPAQYSVHLVNFETSNDREYHLAIFDLTGRAVKKIPRWSNEDIDVSDLPNGMYSLTLWNAGKRIFSDKLIINQ